jgi:hypothetical protein
MINIHELNHEVKNIYGKMCELMLNLQAVEPIPQKRLRSMRSFQYYLKMKNKKLLEKSKSKKSRKRRKKKKKKKKKQTRKIRNRLKINEIANDNIYYVPVEEENNRFCYIRDGRNYNIPMQETTYAKDGSFLPRATNKYLPVIPLMDPFVYMGMHENFTCTGRCYNIYIPHDEDETFTLTGLHTDEYENIVVNQIRFVNLRRPIYKFRPMFGSKPNSFNDLRIRL